MGLDGVELVLAVEDAFDIQIDDSQAGKLRTPRLLIDYVLSKVTTATATVCLTQRAFNLLRKSLLRQGGWKRSEIKPDTKLPALLPKQQRRAVIEKVVSELSIKKPPEWVRPGWLNAMLLGGSVLAGLVAAIFTIHVTYSIGIWIFIGVAILTAVIGLKLTKPLCKEFPSNLQTIGDLARWVMTHKSDIAQATIPGWTRDQVAARVREIVAEQLGIKPDFSEDANFVKDLGMG
jgi:acyl carrier protein